MPVKDILVLFLRPCGLSYIFGKKLAAQATLI